MTELEQALRELEAGGYSVIIRKGETVLFTSTEPMLRPLLRALEELGEELRGSTVIDRIVGKAAAFLCVEAGASRVLTPLASQPAVDYLRARGVHVAAARIVPFIRNRDGSDMCPMERLALRCSTPREFLQALREKAEQT